MSTLQTTRQIIQKQMMPYQRQFHQHLKHKKKTNETYKQAVKQLHVTLKTK